MKSIRLVKSSHNAISHKTDITGEISKVSVSFLVLCASLIGCWAAIGIVTATANSGGTTQLIKDLATVLIG